MFAAACVLLKRAGKVFCFLASLSGGAAEIRGDIGERVDHRSISSAEVIKTSFK